MNYGFIHPIISLNYQFIKYDEVKGDILWYNLKSFDTVVIGPYGSQEKSSIGSTIVARSINLDPSRKLGRSMNDNRARAVESDVSTGHIQSSAHPPSNVISWSGVDFLVTETLIVISWQNWDTTTFPTFRGNSIGELLSSRASRSWRVTPSFALPPSFYL